MSESGLTSRPAAPISYNAGPVATPLGGGFVFPTAPENTAVGTFNTEQGGTVTQTILGSTYFFPTAGNDAPAGPPPGTTPFVTTLGTTVFLPTEDSAPAPTQTGGTATGGTDQGGDTDTAGTRDSSRVTVRTTVNQGGDPVVRAQGDPENATFSVNGQGVDLQAAIENTDGPVEAPGTGGPAREVATPAAPTDTASNDTDVSETGGGTRFVARITQDENGNPLVAATGTGNANLQVNEEDVDLDNVPDVPADLVPAARTREDSAPEVATPAQPTDTGGNDTDASETGGGTRFVARITQDENGNPQVAATGTGTANLQVNEEDVDLDNVPDVPADLVPPTRTREDSLTPSASLDIDGNEDNVTARINGDIVEQGDPIFGPREPIDTTPAGEGNSDGVVESNGFVIGTEGNDTLVSTDPDNTNFNALGGDDILIAGEGDDRLSGGEGVDSFVINQGGGRDRIFDFDPAAGETITVNVDGINSFSDLADNAFESSARVQFDLGAGNTLDVFGVSIDDLGPENFNFNA